MTQSDFFVRAGILEAKHKSEAASLLNQVPELHQPLATNPSHFVKQLWSAVEREKNNNIRGSAFELILAACLAKSQIGPVFREAEIEYVPNVRFDFVLWSKESGPVVISAKTSLRERYKQADLEAMALRSVHRRSRTYLVTLDAKDAPKVAQKILQGDVSHIDQIVLADTDDFDLLVGQLAIESFIVPSPIRPIRTWHWAEK